MSDDRKKFELFPKDQGILPYVFLLYILLPIITMLTLTGVQQMIGYLLIVVFLVTYRQLYFTWKKKSFSYWLALQLGVIFTLVVFFNPNSMFLGFFSAHFISFYTDKKKFLLAWNGLLIIIVAGIMTFWADLTLRDLAFLIPFSLVMLCSPIGFREMTKRSELERKLNKANDRIKELVKQEERIRISRDLHDTLGHTLSFITLKSQVIAKTALKHPERAQIEAKEIETTSRAALKQMRELVSDMQTVHVEDEMNQAQSILHSAGIAFQQNVDPLPEDFPRLLENVLGLCLREAVTNVVKHSNATICSVLVQNHEAGVKMMIKDDGTGVDDNHELGNGLKGMVERLALVDGSMSVKAETGTVLTINIPISIKENITGVSI